VPVGGGRSFQHGNGWGVTPTARRILHGVGRRRTLVRSVRGAIPTPPIRKPSNPRLPQPQCVRDHWSHLQTGRPL